MKIDAVSVDLAERFLSLMNDCNAANNEHAYQVGGAYGAAHDGIYLAVVGGLIMSNPDQSIVELQALAGQVRHSCIDNGESVAYNLLIHKITPPVICVCGDVNCDCGCIPGEYPCEHGTVGEGC